MFCIIRLVPTLSFVSVLLLLFFGFFVCLFVCFCFFVFVFFCFCLEISVVETNTTISNFPEKSRIVKN